MDSALSLNDVVDLGGNKQDLNLVNDVNDDDEAIDIESDFDDEPIKKEEIQALINELGIPSVLKNFDSEKKVKLYERPLNDEEKAALKEAKNAKAREDTNKKKLTEKKANIPADTTIEKWWNESVSNRSLALYQLGEGHWYEHKCSSDDLTAVNDVDNETKEKIQTFAQQLMAKEVELHRQMREKHKKSDTAWLKMVLSSGTTADRSAALTLLVQEAPVVSLSYLESLISLAKKKSRRETLGALDTVKQLLLSDLLPGDRKLRTLFERPVVNVNALCEGNKDLRDRKLLFWYFESELKKVFVDFISTLETLSYDVMPVVKKKAITILFDLLANKPEQEKRLLSALVNKLGDPDYKVAANCSHLLTRLVLQHPLMKAVVVDEVERLLYRPNISTKAQYYGICFLTQLKLSTNDQPLAARLINIYFSFFKAVVKRHEIDSRMMSALLTGVNRAFPYAKVVKSQFSDEMTTLYQTVHTANFNTSLQALMLLYQATDSDMADRYYSALYRKLADPDLLTSNKQTLFLNLLFKSLSRDEADNRVKSFIKRLLQVCLHQQPSFVCGALVLISQLLKKRQHLLNISKRSEHGFYFPMPKYSNNDRLVAACLYQYSDKETESDDEHFEDVPEEEADKVNVKDEDNNELVTDELHSECSNGLASKQTHGSWLHRKHNVRDGKYDPHCRNPLFSRADGECVFELVRLQQHFHPSVALFASSLAQKQLINYSGDPLHDFTQIKFLDRFVYRNPKHITAGEEKNLPIRSVPVNSEQFFAKPEAEIPADELFFHRFFSEKANERKEKEEMKSDTESVSDDEFDNFLDKYEHGLGIDNDEDINFASEMGKEAKLLKDNDLSDEEVSFGSDMDEEFDDIMSDSDEKGSADERDEDEDDDIEDDNDNDVVMPKNRMKRKAKSGSLSELFADADEFADLLDDDMTGDNADTITSEALVNTDKAHAKQLKWEEKRMKHDNIDWRRKKVQATKRKLKKPSRGKNIKIKQNMNKHSKKQTNYQKKRHSKH